MKLELLSSRFAKDEAQAAADVYNSLRAVRNKRFDLLYVENSELREIPLRFAGTANLSGLEIEQ